MKNCTREKCSQVNPQPLSCFSKCKQLKSGLRSQCKSCDSNRRKSDKEKRAKYDKEWEKNHPGWRRIYEKKWTKNNPDKVKAKDAKYRINNPAKKAAKEMRRIAKKLKASPPWLTEEHYKQIEEFYTLAKELQWLSQEPLHVDHIYPLQGENVSGLHVPWNLQILPKSMNIKKGNRVL